MTRYDVTKIANTPTLWHNSRSGWLIHIRNVSTEPRGSNLIEIEANSTVNWPKFEKITYTLALWQMQCQSNHLMLQNTHQMSPGQIPLPMDQNS